MDDQLASESIENTICTTQWFGFTVEDFVDEVENEMLDIIEDALEDLNNKITNEKALTEGVKKNSEMLRIAMYNMKCLMSSDLQESYNKLKDYLYETYFYIPENVSMLQIPMELSHSPSPEEETDLDKELQDLSLKVKQSHAASCQMKKDIKEIDVAQSKVEMLQQQYEDRGVLLKTRLKALGDARTSLDSIEEMELSSLL